MLYSGVIPMGEPVVAWEDDVKPSGWSSTNRPLVIGGPGGREAALGNFLADSRGSGS